MKTLPAESAARRITVIEHEPLGGDAAQTEPSLGGDGYSYRLPVRASAITGDFFSRQQHSDRPGPASSNEEWPSFAIPVAALGLAFTLAVTIPTGFIALSEHINEPVIDPVATASIGRGGRADVALDVSDLSMTRMLKSGTAAVTVFGSIENRSSASVLPGEVVIQLLDSNGDLLQSWRHRTGAAQIAPGKSLRFMTSAIDVTGKAESVVARATALDMPTD